MDYEVLKSKILNGLVSAIVLKAQKLTEIRLKINKKLEADRLVNEYINDIIRDVAKKLDIAID